MLIILDGVWCRSKSEFNRFTNRFKYDKIISYPDIYTKLAKSDPDYTRPSNFIVSLEVQKIIYNLAKSTYSQNLKIAYMFEQIETKPIENLKSFLQTFNTELYFRLNIIEDAKMPEQQVINLFDQIKFIDDD